MNLVDICAAHASTIPDPGGVLSVMYGEDLAYSEPRLADELEMAQWCVAGRCLTSCLRPGLLAPVTPLRTGCWHRCLPEVLHRITVPAMIDLLTAVVSISTRILG